jgi:beta-glucanase (GH16 family)
VQVHNGELDLVEGFDGSGRDESGGVGNRVQLQFGRWSVRFKVDAGAGSSAEVLLWPKNNADWPAAGEIDFAEVNRADRSFAHLTVHNGSNNKQVASIVHADFTTYHTVGVEWTQDHVAFYLDGVLQSFEVTTAANPGMVPDLTPMHLALQLDVGCDSWIPCRTASTPATVTMHIAWVKIYALP